MVGVVREFTLGVYFDIISDVVIDGWGVGKRSKVGKSFKVRRAVVYGPTL